MSRRVIAAVLMLLVTAVAGPADARRQDKTLLARKARVGDVTRSSAAVSLTATINGQQLSLELKVIDKFTVTEVGADGRLTMRQEMESASVSIAGNAIPSPPTPAPNTLVTSPTRALMTYKSGEGNAEQTSMETRMYSATTVVFSDKPVAVGDTWTRTIAADPALGLQPAKAEYRVLAFEKVGTVDTVKISMSCIESGPDGLQASGTFWVDRVTGEDVKAEYQFKNAPFPDLGLASGTVKQERLASR